MNCLPESAARRRPWLDALLWCLILLACVVRFVPLSPAMPRADLDPSWRYGLEQALAQGLVFGRDLMFTFGPYASVYTRSYHPATDTLMLAASLYLACCYALTLGLLIGRGRRGWGLVLLLLVAGPAATTPDALLFLLPLLVGLVLFQRQPQAGAATAPAPASAPGLAELAVLALLFAPLGLMPLIKGTLLLLCAMVALLCAGWLYAQRRRREAVVCLLAPALMLPLCWALSGQPMAALPAYFGAMLEIISGYTEAMARGGVVREPLLFLAAGAGLLWAVARLPAVARPARLFLLLLYGGFLFLSFKAGFVRQDEHVMIAVGALLMAAVALAVALPARHLRGALALALLSWLVADHHYQNTTPAGLARGLAASFESAWAGATGRLRQPSWPDSQYQARLRQLRQQAALPLLDGSSDIYSFNQTLLIASGNRWSPRPVMQSYSAYTPALAAADVAHLSGPAAPDHVFFAVETIDERYPALDDGPSWPVLLADYQPAGRAGGMLVLQHRPVAGGGGAQLPAPAPDLAPTSVSTSPPTPVPTPVPAPPDSVHRFGEVVRLPAGGPVLFAQFDIRPTLLGRAAALLFRAGELELTVTLADGAQKRYRLVSGMARAGFVLSPLVEDTAEFAQLYGAGGGLERKRVVALSVDVRAGQWRRLWQGEYRVSLRTLPSGRAANEAGRAGGARL